MSVSSETRYVELIHISDLHFGADHRFSPELTPDGAAAVDESDYPDLADVLIKDLSDPANEPPRPHMGVRANPGTGAWDVPPMPKIFCMSGDFTTTASKEEFAKAVNLVKKLTQPPPETMPPPEGFVVCPGNHDLDWKAGTVALRWQAYTNFLNDIYPDKYDSNNAMRFGGVTVFEKNGVLVLSLNSEMNVFDKSGDRFRGDLSQAQLAWMETQLDAIAPEKLRAYIKVAMVHHHPILIPSLAEPSRSYDAINGAQDFLTRLHRYGFHVILHGHKHYPHTFHENVRNAFERTDEHSLVVVAGGSCGSKSLPAKPRATQTYNRVRIHWCADQGSTRVQVVTRGLARFRADSTELLANQWHWETIATDDRYFLFGRRTRVSSPSAMNYEAPSPDDKVRQDEYRRTRGNFPVAEIRPSLLPGQTNEVLLRIVRHGVGSTWRSAKDDPIAVTWSAGPKFPKVTVTREQDPDFCGVFAYYDSALMQAEMKFQDGSSLIAFIYSPMLPAASVASGNTGKPPVNKSN